MATIAGLPRSMVLRSKVHDRYLHYFWDDRNGEGYLECMGTRRIVDEVNPFVRLEVVPSTTAPSSLVHLRCSFNGKYWRIVIINTFFIVTATADAPEEDVSKGRDCTLFEPVFSSDSHNTVWFRHVASGNQVWVFDNNQIPILYQVACCYSRVDRDARFFEFMEWESCQAKLQRLKDKIQELKDQVAGLELQEEERKAKLEEESEHCNPWLFRLGIHSSSMSGPKSIRLRVTEGHP